MESLLFLPWEEPETSHQFFRAMLTSGGKWWNRQARDPPPLREDSCLILCIKELAFLPCLMIMKTDNGGFAPNIVCLFPVFHPRLFAVWPHRNRKYKPEILHRLLLLRPRRLTTRVWNEVPEGEGWYLPHRPHTGSSR
jgi:hypothetical protein